MNIAVLGSGLVGGTIARDLAEDKSFKVTVIDRSEASLDKLGKNFAGKRQCADAGDIKKVAALVKPFDIVVGALPGFMAFNVIREIIKAGKHTVDISFYPEDPFELDALARDKDVIAITDCGVAPGIPNIIAGRMQEEWDELTDFTYYVGGLPEVREQPFEYRACFSPIDVIEEYTRPARMMIDGKVVTKPALSGIETINVEGLGTLEGFNTDGLRTLLRTLKCPNMKEKTLRYPGHARLMEIFRETGLFHEDTVDVGGKSIRPVDLTAKLLFPLWELPKGERDLVVLIVEIEGRKGKKPFKRRWQMVDHYDVKNHVTSMARTTGYTCSVAVRAVARKVYTTPGMSPPEFLGKDKKVHDFMLTGLAERGVVLNEA
ncbi:MAG: saccharopine dehydrogenase NADP-binding domain-containing protein [Planctomycetes bacterium]|nr:saccharopine dehydrogenase NADP-binding domain-containing protein [Planctomycetota bacterium]NUQ34350.1 saccharopine dehydrogenase NADP-binding domain-containing protein [Planctomycetaceae bacterium]